jgi:hypothetical protein
VFSGFIDVWNAKTFDCELGAMLAEEADLVRSHMTTERRIFLAHDLGRAPERSIIRPYNPYASSFQAFGEAISEPMRSRMIRAWHYTGLAEFVWNFGEMRSPIPEEPSQMIDSANTGLF